MVSPRVGKFQHYEELGVLELTEQGQEFLHAR